MLEPFFRWCESSLIGKAVAESVWAFPILEAVHLIGLCALGGALLVVDLRLLGVGLTAQPIARLARYARPWLIGSRCSWSHDVRSSFPRRQGVTNTSLVRCTLPGASPSLLGGNASRREPATTNDPEPRPPRDPRPVTGPWFTVAAAAAGAVS